jgi:hypothetical protein
MLLAANSNRKRPVGSDPQTAEIRLSFSSLLECSPIQGLNYGNS